MADDDLINQDEIEALLQQAQGGDSPEAAEQAAPAADAGNASLDQSEIEALISGAPTTAAAPAAPSSAGAPPSSPGSDVDLLLQKAEAAIASIDEPLGELPPGWRRSS